MPTYKLCYFNARGTTEMCRLAFAEAGVEYEDIRYTTEEWPEHKKEMLFGQVPVLFVDGEQIAHSRAILRFLVREFKMDGGSPLNAAKLDMWIEVLTETFLKLPLREQDQAKKVEQMKQIMKEDTMPRLLKLEESMKGTYLFGEEPSGVDFGVYSILDLLRRMGVDEFLDLIPKVKAMMDALEARPKIARWIKERPDTAY